MNLQPDLFGVEPAPVVVPAPRPVYVLAPRAVAVSGAPNLFVHFRPALENPQPDLEGSPLQYLPWPAYRQTPDQTARRLAVYLRRSNYRPFRAWCGHVVVVSVEQWQDDVEQWPCLYRGCAGWVQRDSECISAVSSEGGGGGEGNYAEAGGVARDLRGADGVPGGDAGRDRGLVDGLDDRRADEAQEPPEWLEEY